MRTAEEIKHQLSISQHPLDCICKQCKGGTEMFLTDEDIEAIQDEAVAHGMTLSAEISRTKFTGTNDGCDAKYSIQKDILSTRDNKVWRKE